MLTGSVEVRVRFTMSYRGTQPGTVESLPRGDADLLLSQGWVEPVD